jgi:hypothetical protein
MAMQASQSYISVEIPESRNRIPSHTAVLMGSTAFFFDTLQGLFGIFHSIPVAGTVLATAIGWAVTFIAAFTFFLWFKLHGISFLDSGVRKLITFFGGTLIELVPLLNILPAWTLSVMLLIVIVRTEDTLYNKTHREFAFTS